MGENTFCEKNTLGRTLFFVDATAFEREENTRAHCGYRALAVLTVRLFLNKFIFSL